MVIYNSYDLRSAFTGEHAAGREIPSSISKTAEI